MAQRIVTIQIGIGTPRTGLWCHRCLLPSRIEVDVWALRRDGLHKIGTVAECRGGCHADR